MGGGSAANNRGRDAGPGQQPGEGNLARSGRVSFRDAFNFGQDAKAALVHVSALDTLRSWRVR